MTTDRLPAFATEFLCLEIPPHKYLSDGKLLIGEDDAA